VSIYAHNERRLVEEGARVGQGDVIAHVGASGRVSKAQLHFELRRGVTPRNPAGLLPPRKDLPKP
jgi:murein DD-endopeptidase MepM/ murein hydrolase activator NlpD